MRFKNSQDFTYLGYVHQTWYDKNITDESQIGPALNQFNQLTGPVSGLMPMFIILDYTARQYVAFTDSIKLILGYDVREPLEGGLGFTLHIAEKDFFKSYNAKIFPAIMDSLKCIPQHEHQDHVFTFNMRFRNKEGRYINTLQKSTYITSKETGLPLYCIAMITDISAYKKDGVMVHTVEKVDAIARTLQTVETKYFYPYEEDGLLTKQELNIVKYMADGLSSKMIAFKLGISENTIANHRKNMLRKTNSQNVAHLIGFVIRNKMI